MRKTGRISAVIQAGVHPADCGFPNLGNGSRARDHESYVVHGGIPAAKTADYWPRVSALQPPSGALSEWEYQWCRRNADKVRALIAAEPMAEGGK